MALQSFPSEFEAETNATYEALLWALSRPGLIRHLPGLSPVRIVEALIDRECCVHCTEPELAAIAARTGAAMVSPELADHVFAGALTSAGMLRRLRLGSDLYPEDGATLVCAAALGQGARLRLSGPGCDGAVTVAVGGMPEGFWQERTRLIRYPMGFELLLVDSDRVMGVPRSTMVEVL